MRIKKTIKRMGKFFITLKQEDERIIGQSVLIVDNGYIEKYSKASNCLLMRG